MKIGRRPGNEHAAERLEQILQSGRYGNAYLFRGPEGAGMLECAFEFAAGLVGEESAARVATGAHPAVLLRRPEGAGRRIPIATVRELQDAFALRSTGGGRRVAVLQEADRLTEEAANALLKILEEPPAGVTWILVTAFPAGLPPTIHSRCQSIVFYPPPQEAVRERWMRVGGLSPEEAEIATALGIREEEKEAVPEARELIELAFRALQTGEVERVVERATKGKDPEKGREEARRVLRALAFALRDRLAGRDSVLARRLPQGIDPLTALEAVLEHEIFLGRNAHAGLTLENALLKVGLDGQA